MHIGIFDSGFGGLTIFKSIRARLPQYDYVYLGDNARTPYGSRSFDAIFRFTRECLEELFARDCKLVVIACNTASAKALRTIQQKVLPVEHPDRKVLGIIRPSAEALSHHPRTRSVALWGTEGTVKSQSFALELEKLAPGLGLIQKACPLLVPMVEAGELDGAGIDHYIAKYWRETVALAVSEANTPGSAGTGISTTGTAVDPGSLSPERDRIGALLLACTHYPLLLPRIRAIVPPEVDILVQGDIVAPSLADYLSRHPEVESLLSRNRTQRFLTTDQTEGFDRLSEVFLGHPVISEKIAI
ncbi:MAG: glutamate racemase [Fibrobacteres bacterium]|nr:glutamate racemase [Fibrobacterota bacterium]